MTNKHIPILPKKINDTHQTDNAQQSEFELETPKKFQSPNLQKMPPKIV